MCVDIARADAQQELLLEGLPATAKDLPRCTAGCGEGGFSVWPRTRLYLDRLHGVFRAPDAGPLAGTFEWRRRPVPIPDGRHGQLAPCGGLVQHHRKPGAWCHAESKSAYLHEVRRVLRPGGVFRCARLLLPTSPGEPAAEALSDEGGLRGVSGFLRAVEGCGIDYLASAGFSEHFRSRHHLESETCGASDSGVQRRTRTC